MASIGSVSVISILFPFSLPFFQCPDNLSTIAVVVREYLDYNERGHLVHHRLTPARETTP
jgi:hypothetical protein